jgi:mono/diheme cytochrome c family protein
MHKHKRVFGIGLIALGLIAVGLGPLAQSDAKEVKVDGKHVFEQNCAGCHQSGGNKVNPNHPVAGSDKLKSMAMFKSYLSAPPGHMPYYEQVVKDKKTLEALYNYCKSLPKQPIKQASL